MNLLKKPSLLFAAIGIFLYVGAEVVIGSFAVNYFLEMNVVKELAAYPQLLSLKHFLGKTVLLFSLYLLSQSHCSLLFDILLGGSYGR